MVIDLMIESSRSVVKIEVLTFSMFQTNTCHNHPCLKSHLGHVVHDNQTDHYHIDAQIGYSVSVYYIVGLILGLSSINISDCI